VRGREGKERYTRESVRYTHGQNQVQRQQQQVDGKDGREGEETRSCTGPAARSWKRRTAELLLLTVVLPAADSLASAA
jgi:hypothetical protein